jgi:hypothetical protein
VGVGCLFCLPLVAAIFWRPAGIAGFEWADADPIVRNTVGWIRQDTTTCDARDGCNCRAIVLASAFDTEVDGGWLLEVAVESGEPRIEVASTIERRECLLKPRLVVVGMRKHSANCGKTQVDFVSVAVCLQYS